MDFLIYVFFCLSPIIIDRSLEKSTAHWQFVAFSYRSYYINSEKGRWNVGAFRNETGRMVIHTRYDWKESNWLNSLFIWNYVQCDRWKHNYIRIRIIIKEIYLHTHVSHILSYLKTLLSRLSCETIIRCFALTIGAYLTALCLFTSVTYGWGVLFLIVSLSLQIMYCVKKQQLMPMLISVLLNVTVLTLGGILYDFSFFQLLIIVELIVSVSALLRKED